jgi:DNA-binding transcriptional ArsR family regulator
MSIASEKIVSKAQLAAVARLFSALAEPSRLTLLHALRQGTKSVSELVATSKMKQANVSKHLAVLRQHHLVKPEREGNSIRYEIADPLVFGLCDLVCSKLAADTRKAAALFSPDI